jgi:hypothetical protein
LDTLRFRADSRINEIIRQTGKTKKFRRLMPTRTCARRRCNFFDHVHGFAGNYLVVALRGEVERHWSGARTNDLPWLTEPRSRGGWLGRNSISAVGQRCARDCGDCRSPPRATSARGKALGRDDCRAFRAAGGLRFGYQAAVVARPETARYANFGCLLMTLGDYSGAQWSVPQSHGCCRTRRKDGPTSPAARLAGETIRAKEFLQEALKLQRIRSWCKPSSAF